MSFSYAKEGINLLKTWASLPLPQTLSRPISINILITDRCNSKCESCDIWKNGADGKDPLGIDFYQTLARDIRTLGTSRITLSGGEPLLRSDLADIIAAFTSQRIHTQLTTHGLHASGPRLNELWQAGLNTLTFSLDHHTPEGYQKIRGVNWLDRVSQHLREAVRTKPKDRMVETNSVISSFNIDAFPQILDYALSLGVDGVNFSPVVESGESNLIQIEKTGLRPTVEKAHALVSHLLSRKKQERRIKPSAAFIKGIPAYFENPHAIAFNCYAGYVSMDVYTNGDVRLCGSMPIFDNVRDKSLAEVWFSAQALKQRQAMQQRNCPGCYVSCKIEPSLLVNPTTALPSITNRLWP